MLLDAKRGAAAFAVAALLAAPAGALASQKTPSATKLLHGPIAFRLTGWQHADPTTSLGDYRYAIAFKLNRDPQGRLPDTDEVQNRGTTRGIFALDGWDTDVGRLYPSERAPAGKANCFVGYVAGAADTDPAWLRKEDRKPLGTRVRVRLRPLDRRPDGTNAYSRQLVRRPHLQQADVALKSAAARRALAKIGC